MLDALRNSASSWVAQVLIGLLVLSFAVWGVSDIFNGFRADTIASVGETDVTVSDFARQYDLAKRNLERQAGQPLTAEQARLYGLPGQVLGRLVTDATLSETARQYGVGISNESLKTKIAEDPAFYGPSGSFDRLYFTEVLRNNNLTEDQFVRDQHAAFLRYQISNALVGGSPTPDAYMEAIHDYQSEVRGIAYVILTAANVDEIAAPGDSDIRVYFEGNKGQWQAPEYRALSLFQVLPADIAKPEDITDEQAKANYDSRIDAYRTLERRRVFQMHFDSEDAAKAAVAEIAGGKSFDDVAAERNLTASDTGLGLVTRDEIVDPKISEAAFSLEAGTTSGVVKSDFGWMVVRVTEIQPEVVKPFETVKADIKKTMALDLATRRIIDTYDRVEDARAAGDTFAEIADQIGVPLVTIDAVDQSGEDPGGEKLVVPGGRDLLAAAFQTDVGIENDAVRTKEKGYVWYEVTSVTAERERTLEEVRKEVVKAWTAAELDKRLSAKAEEIRKRVAGGEALETVAADQGLNIRTLGTVTRASQPPPGLTADVVNAAFNGPKGYVAIAPGTAGAKVVLTVTDSTIPPYNPDAVELAQIRKQLSDQIASDMFQQFVVDRQDELGVSINQVALQAVVGQQQQSGF